MIQIQKDKDKILLSITTQLDREDVYEIVSDLSKWLEDTLEIPKFKGIDEEAVKEAMEQNAKKQQLGEEIRLAVETQMESLVVPVGNAELKPITLTLNTPKGLEQNPEEIMSKQKLKIK